MERFEVKRGLVKQVTAEGGLAALASRHFEVVEADEKNSFSGSHDIMTSIVGHYSDKGCLLYTSPSPRDYAASRMPSSA